VRFWHQRHQTPLFGCQDFGTAEVTAISDDGQRFLAERLLRVHPHRGQLRAVMADIRDLMGHDPVMARANGSVWTL
jgi:hypothetical protein